MTRERGRDACRFAALHNTTYRPAVGYTGICILEDFEAGLRTMTHEMMHALVRGHTYA